jgi:hypothetical protein
MPDDVTNGEIERLCELSGKFSIVLIDLVTFSERQLPDDYRQHLVEAVTELSEHFAEFEQLCAKFEREIVIADPAGAASIAEFALADGTKHHFYIQETAHQVASITLGNIAAEFAVVQEHDDDDEIQRYAHAVIRQNFNEHAIFRLTSRMGREITLLASKYGIRPGHRKPNGHRPRFKFGNGDGK